MGGRRQLQLGASQDFARQVLEHLDAAYKFARQLTHNVHDAEDVVQEAYLRALRSATRFRGGNARPWLLRIVRNVFYSSLQQSHKTDLISRGHNVLSSQTVFRNPERALLRRAILHKALKTLPAHSLEVLILREVEEMSYGDIAAQLKIPRGTVMSRLSRARARLRECESSG